MDPLQHIYAANLRQNYGYPLRKPEPNSRLGQPYVKEGLQVGDVGYVDDDGEFIWLFNIRFPLPPEEMLPEEFRDRNLDPPEKFIELAEPAPEQGFDPGMVLMSGVEASLEESRATYEFTVTSETGAILILPDGATLSKLKGEQKLKEFQKHAAKYALQWCRYARRDSLYLVTAAYKTNTWTLGSFCDGSPGTEILVNRQSGENVVPYKWKCQFTVDRRQSPRDNCDFNQTVLIQGFKITVKWDWFCMIERAERSKRWFAHVFAAFWPNLKSRKWLSRKRIEHFPMRNLSQPYHPLDVINRVLLNKSPDAQVAITHDDVWTEMLRTGLSYADLAQENRLQEFLEKEYTWDLGSDERNAVYLQRRCDSVRSPRPCEPAHDTVDSSPTPLSGGNSQLVVTNMRLESIDVDPIFAGVCILIEFGNTSRRTGNKSHASVIDWDDVIILPTGLSVNITVCGTFQLGSTLGIRAICATPTINTMDFPDNTHVVRFPFGKIESCSSLLITLVRRFHSSDFEPHSSPDELSKFVEKTNQGFKALYSHYDEPQRKCLDGALECFQSALEQCDVDDLSCRAAALFNLATSKFIKCQADGTYSELGVLIELYEEALRLQGPGDQDRTATSLLLSQALMFGYGRGHDESLVRRIDNLLTVVHRDGGRDHQTADTIMRTCGLYHTIHSGSPAEVDQLLWHLDHHAHAPPYGFSDWPHILHELIAALWTRFPPWTNADGLEKLITLSKEILYHIPEGYQCRGTTIASLGTLLLRFLEVRGDLKDLDLSAGLAQLGDEVLMELNNLQSGGVGVKPWAWHRLRGQIKLMSTAETAAVDVTPSRQTSKVHGLLDEWQEEDGTPRKCKRHLGILLSFLRGEGETKMRELLSEAQVEWSFKEHKIKETMQVLGTCMPYFARVLALNLKQIHGFNRAAKYQRRNITHNWMFEEELYSELHRSRRSL